MKVCNYCAKYTKDTDTCTDNKKIELSGKIFNPVPYGRERKGPGPERCPTCNVRKGQPHHPGCDIEECPSCGRKIFHCVPMDEDEDDMLYAPDEPEVRGICHRGSCTRPTYNGDWHAEVYITGPKPDENGEMVLEPSLVYFCSPDCATKWIKQEARAAKVQNRKFGMKADLARLYAPKLTFNPADVPELPQNKDALE